MTEDREAASRPARAPLRQRSRKRWAVVAGVAASWVVLELVIGSAVSATVALLVVAALAVATVGGLRAMGITRDHPLLRRIASRPWRDGQDVLRVAMRHLSEVFVVTPSGSLLAPNVVELRLNPDDLLSLRERMEIDVISASLAEVYEDQVASYGARLAEPGRAYTYVMADDLVPPGRYRLRQGHPVGAQFDPAENPVGAQFDPPDDEYADVPDYFSYAAAYPVYAGSGTRAVPPVAPPDQGRTDMITVMEPSLAAVPMIPVLRLITGSSVAETQMSGARAGRGSVELVLPDMPTVSREHATFTYSEGRWWVTNRGRNGLTLNGAPAAGEQPLSDGDEIRWGTDPDAPRSRVEIG
jgi:hypothetical protein